MNLPTLLHQKIISEYVLALSPFGVEEPLVKAPFKHPLPPQGLVDTGYITCELVGYEVQPLWVIEKTLVKCSEAVPVTYCLKCRQERKGKMSKRSSSHRAAQRAGKVRDLYTCQLCGSSQNVAGHHIIDVQYGGSSHIENIITLCDACHKKAHFGSLFMFKF